MIRHIQVLRRMPLRRAEAGVDVLNKILHSIARLNNAFWLDKISHVGNLNIQSEYFSSSWLCNIKFCSITLGPSYFCEKLSICGCCVEKGLVDVWVMEKGFTSNIVSSLWSNPGWRKKAAESISNSIPRYSVHLGKSKINFFKTFTGGGI